MIEAEVCVGRHDQEQNPVSAPHQGCDISDGYAVVIPAYNEAATIRDVARGAMQHVKQVFIVDDGSTDGTAQALEGLPVHLIQNPASMGKAASLYRAFHVAMESGAHACVTLDGDGQHSPADIPRLVAAAQDHPDLLVLGARRRQWRLGPFWRIVANRLADFWISWAAGYPIEDTQSGFRVYPSRLLQVATVKHDKAHGFVFESEILIEAARLGFYSVSLPVESVSLKTHRPSHFRPVLDVLRITRMVAWKLLSRGLFPVGLYRSLFGRSPAAGVNVDQSRPALSSSNPDERSSPER
jgi:glycosyltransferase involved in cell wall biosynthesis